MANTIIELCFRLGREAHSYHCPPLFPLYWYPFVSPFPVGKSCFTNDTQLVEQPSIYMSASYLLELYSICVLSSSEAATLSSQATPLSLFNVNLKSPTPTYKYAICQSSRGLAKRQGLGQVRTRSTGGSRRSPTQRNEAIRWKPRRLDGTARNDCLTLLLVGNTLDSHIRANEHHRNDNQARSPGRVWNIANAQSGTLGLLSQRPRRAS